MALSSELKVGTLFFIGLGLSVWFTLQTSKHSGGPGEYAVNFRRVSRLAPGDPVLYNGVKVGKVATVEPVLVPELGNEPRVKVAFSIDPAAREAVLVGDHSTVRINQGLLGGASMEIVSEDGAKISNESLKMAHTSDPASFDEVMRTVQDILDENRANLKGTIASAKTAMDNAGAAGGEIRDTVAENRAMLKKAIENTERLTAELKAISSENRDNIKSTIANADKAAAQIAALIEENRATVKLALERIAKASEQIAAMVEENRKNVQATTERLPQAVDNLAQAAGQVRDAVAENRQSLHNVMLGVELFAPKLDRIGDNVEKITKQIADGKGTIGKLVMEDTLHDQASGVLTSAQERLDEVKPFTQGVSELHFYAGLEVGGNLQSGAGTGYGYLRIEPRPWKFYEGGLSYRTAPSDRQVTRDNPDKLGVDFNFLLGWRFRPDDSIQRYRISVAAGVIDTKLGGYVEWAATRDLSVRVMARMKDNEREKNDRRYEEGDALVRATVSWRMFDRFYLIGGVDDIGSHHSGPWIGMRAELLDNDMRNVTTAASLGK